MTPNDSESNTRNRRGQSLDYPGQNKHDASQNEKNVGSCLLAHGFTQFSLTLLSCTVIQIAIVNIPSILLRFVPINILVQIQHLTFFRYAA